MEHSIVVETPILLEEEREETLLPESEYSESLFKQNCNRTFKDILANQHLLSKIVAFTF